MFQTSAKRLKDKFDHIYKIITNPAFLKLEALGGEIPFFISAYSPSDELLVQAEIELLIKRSQNEGLKILKIDLFELCIDLLKDRGIWGKILESEPKHTKDRLSRILQAPLNPENYIAPEIERRLNQASYHLVFIIGVGMVYPFLRSHTILNNLQRIIKYVPTIMFFPGKYDGTKLELFGKLKDDNYYRAYNLDEFNI